MDEKESYVIEGWTAIWECYVGERESGWVKSGSGNLFRD